MKMRFLTILLLALAFYSCEEAQETDSTANDTQDEVTEDSKDFLTEVITRKYAVKTVDGKPAIDTLQRMQSIKIDADGKELETIFYNLDGSEGWVDRYIYDSLGNKIGSDYFDKGVKNTIYYSYEIDDKGRKTSYQAYDHGTDALLYDGATRYENFGKLKKDGYINDKGDFICNFEYQLDDDGKELGYVYIDNSSGARYQSLYKYIDFNDDNKWVKRYLLKDGEVQSIETREFVRIDIE